MTATGVLVAFPGVSRDAERLRATFRPAEQWNAELLVASHGADIRYCAELGWLAWDGRRWQRDTTGGAMRLAKKTARTMYTMADDCDDPDERKALGGWAVKSESEAKLRATVALASTERDVVIRQHELDADPWLLEVANGTIDLRTGKLREHDRRALSTKLARATYEPGATDARFEAFLARVTGGDDELAAFLQRAVGYTLTGDTGEEVLFFAHGPGATGKSTLLEALKAMLGDYASTADFETFLRRRGDAGIRNDVARLAGARMVLSVEVDEGKHLAEGLLKSVTGGDTIAARFLHKEYFEFRPVFKLWLAANSRPRVNADDAAMWRRIVQVPFTVVIPEPERDPTLKTHLKRDAGAQSAILAWAVEGCLAWQREGLNVPDRVRDYTDEYRSENDPVAEWLEDHCLLGPEHKITSGALRSDYETWTRDNGSQPLGAKRFAAALKTHGCEQARTAGARLWTGISLRDVTP